MKNIKNFVFPFFVSIILILNFSACKEDKYADWKILNEKWLETLKETHKNDPGFKITESGLCYKVIHQGIMRRPSSSSWIKANYKGLLIQNYTGNFDKDKLFDSGVYFRFLSEAVPGWREGILKMNGGGKYIFYIPASLGYGEDGAGAIAPYSTLIFEVELLDSGE